MSENKSGISKVKEMAKKAKQKIKELILKIKNLIKFFTTPIGWVVFIIIAAIIMAINVYVIITTLLSAIGYLVWGEAAFAQSDKQSYDFLKQLTDSGYDAMLNAEEFIDFYAFEYATLMDAARFMEETGTMTLEPQNLSKVDYTVLSPDQLALMRAMAWQPDGTDINQVIAEIESEYGIRIENPEETTRKKREEEERRRRSGDESGDENDENGHRPIDINDFGTEATKENLFYYPVYNEYTKEYSLVPYLEIVGQHDKLKFYLEMYKPDGTQYEPSEIIDAKMFGREGRFTIGYAPDGASAAEAFMVMRGVHAATIVPELNARNWSVYSTRDAMWGTGPEEVDLYKEYKESMYFENIQTPSQYKIPLRILLDRFLPNSTLLSSWRLLKDEGENGTVGEDVAAEIQEIYSEACLKDEKTGSGEKLLLKDVYLINTDIDENTKATELFDKIVVQKEAKFEYLHSGDTNSGDTNLLYGSYQPEFDSRNLKASGDNGSGDALPAQEFTGTFADDVIDDIELILKHFAEDNNVAIEEKTYRRILDDALKVMEPDEEKPISLTQSIVYTPLIKGGYRTECVAVETKDESAIREHYGLSETDNINSIYKDGNPEKWIIREHKEKNDAYTSQYTECFLPLLKIAYTIDKEGLRKTAVIICHNDKFYSYMVKGKEIDDFSKISNVRTFAYFETFDAKATTFGHWEVPGSEEGSIEAWAVTDAFEGMSIKCDYSSASFNYELPDGTKGRIEGQYLIDLWKSYTGTIDIDKLFEESVLDVVSKWGGNVILPGDIAIIRQNADPTSRNYEGEMLALPFNATPDNPELGNSNLSSMAERAERQSKLVENMFVSLKSLGLKEGQDIPQEFFDDVKSSFRSKIYNRMSDNFYKKVVRFKEYGISMSEPLSEEEEEISISAKLVSLNITKPEFAVVFPVKRIVAPITQSVTDRGVRFYMVNRATLWSSNKYFINNIIIHGIYKNSDRQDERFLVQNMQEGKGIIGYETSKEIDWRCKLYAPVFAGESEKGTTARESDILLLLSEWEDASKKGIHAADHYIRDLYALINYSKGITYLEPAESAYVTEGDKVKKDEEPTYITKKIDPILQSDGKTPYIHPGSYTYLYIPPEILEFDDTISEKAFWMDRLLVTPDEDPIEEATENYLRSKAETFTWQIVDYELYEECQNLDEEGKPTGTYKVYALWPFGSQYSRSLYAFASNASNAENDRVMIVDAEPNDFQGWGGYFPCHRAADWYGRSMSRRIYDEVFGKTDNAAIKAKYENGKVTLIDTDTTPGKGLYESEETVRLKLGDKTYTFNGTAAAVYGYELYRQTLINKDENLAEQIIKEQLNKETKWTEIRAVAPGIVKSISSDSGSGFAVAIMHADYLKTAEGEESEKGVKVSTSYCHMKRYPLVQEGQYVGAGTLLGYEGTTGRSNGFHVHHSYYKNGSPDNPTYYNYPFFTPFFYAEKAAESEYALDSEYMSLERTVFPAGQISGVIEPNEYTTPTNEDGTLVIQNYVPHKPFLEDTEDLLNANSGYPAYRDYSKLQVEGIKNNIGGVNFSGNIIKTNPQYFDRSFIAGVVKNNNKITGAKPAKPILLPTEVVGGFTRLGWQYVWSYKSLNDKPIIKRTVTPSEADYQAFDAELKRQVEIAGKGTRGAVVTAARFLAGFPYVIPYRGCKDFENNIGAYGHYGISRNWGVRLAGVVNGIDCSAFVNWTMVNAGIIAEGSSEYCGNNANARLYGTAEEPQRTYLLKEAYEKGIEIKPGDFYHTKNENYDPNIPGGATVGPNGEKIKTGRFTHIGIIIAVDDKYIYVAEESSCMNLGRYRRDSDKHYVTLCDNIYAGEGNYDDQLYPENEIPLPTYFKEEY